jgi:hypothetical protein
MQVQTQMMMTLVTVVSLAMVAGTELMAEVLVMATKEVGLLSVHTQVEKQTL